MARKFPYQKASIYLAWRAVRGADYARSLFPDTGLRTYYDWESRLNTDPQLQQLVQSAKIDLGLGELREETIAYIRWLYSITRGIAHEIRTESDPKRITAMADLIKALATMGAIANNVYVDTDPLPPIPQAMQRQKSPGVVYFP